MYWALVFFGPVILMLVGLGAAGSAIAMIADKPRRAMTWIISPVMVALGVGIFFSGITLFDFVLTSIK